MLRSLFSLGQPYFEGVFFAPVVQGMMSYNYGMMMPPMQET